MNYFLSGNVFTKLVQVCNHFCVRLCENYSSEEINTKRGACKFMKLLVEIVSGFIVLGKGCTVGGYFSLSFYIFCLFMVLKARIVDVNSVCRLHRQRCLHINTQIS